MNYMNISENPIIALKAHDRKKLRYKCVNVMRSVVMRLDHFTPDTSHWLLRESANLARIQGIYATSKHLEYFTHESSMILHGIAPWNLSPPVCGYAGGRHNARCLDSIKIYNYTIPVSTYNPVSYAFAGSHPIHVQGMPVESLPFTCLRMAVSRPSTEALAAVSQMLHSLSNFSRHNSEVPRAKEIKIKGSLLTALDKEKKLHPYMQGYNRAKIVLSHTDAGCETLAEAIPQPIVSSIFANEYVSQYRITTNNRTYYADFAVPSIRLLIEFDDAGKLGTTEEEFLDARQSFLKRQSDLQALGYSFFRVTWNDLLEPNSLYYRLLRAALTVKADFRIRTNPVKRLSEDEHII